MMRRVERVRAFARVKREKLKRSYGRALCMARVVYDEHFSKFIYEKDVCIRVPNICRIPQPSRVRINRLRFNNNGNVTDIAARGTSYSP